MIATDKEIEELQSQAVKEFAEEWDYKTGGYKLKVYHKGKYKRISKFAIGHLSCYKAEVIGNIYDNPELMVQL